MGWNHRILAHQENQEDEIYFQIHEVYYDDNDVPNGYTLSAVSVAGSSIDDISWTLDKMRECSLKPVLWAGKLFPSEFNSE